MTPSAPESGAVLQLLDALKKSVAAARQPPQPAPAQSPKPRSPRRAWP